MASTPTVLSCSHSVPGCNAGAAACMACSTAGPSPEHSDDDAGATHGVGRVATGLNAVGRKGLGLAAVRFQARTVKPLRCRLRATGAPIRPVPSTAMVV